MLEEQVDFAILPAKRNLQFRLLSTKILITSLIDNRLTGRNWAYKKVI